MRVKAEVYDASGLLKNAADWILSIHAASNSSSKRAWCTAIAITATPFHAHHARLELKFDAAYMDTTHFATFCELIHSLKYYIM